MANQWAWQPSRPGWTRNIEGESEVIPYTPEERHWFSEIGNQGNWATGVGELIGSAMTIYGPAMSLMGAGPIAAAISYVGREMAQSGVDDRALYEATVAPPPDDYVPPPREAIMWEEEGWSSIFGNGGDSTFSWGDLAQTGMQIYSAYNQPQVQARPAAAMPMPVSNEVFNPAPGTNLMTDTGEVIPTGNPAVAGAIWLGSWLARAFGRAAGAAGIWTGANGVRVRMSQLWPLVRKYGPAAVAGGLGISLGALGELLMRAPQHTRRRARGISARDVKTTRRTLRTIKKLYNMMPTRPARRSWGGGYRRRSYRRY